jgi:hypothetical protein
MNIVTAAPAAASTDTSPIRVEPVRNAAALRRFIRLPGIIYRGHPGYVAPLELERLDALRQDKNPFYQHASGEYWLAYKGISAISTARTIRRCSQHCWRPPPLGLRPRACGGCSVPSA